MSSIINALYDTNAANLYTNDTNILILTLQSELAYSQRSHSLVDSYHIFMSGHSKWSKIKREKQAKDKVKGNIFSKLARQITFSVIEGGNITDPEKNVKLRLAIEKAKSYNLPKQNIERAILKASGPDRSSLKEIIYEAFGPGGTSIVILVTTDNINRALSEIRRILDKFAGKLGNQRSVMYLFKKCTAATFNVKDISEEEIFALADKIEAFDIDKTDDHYTVYFPFELLGQDSEFLKRLKLENTEVVYKPNSLIKVEDEATGRKIQELLEALEDLDDVQKVFANY